MSPRRRCRSTSSARSRVLLIGDRAVAAVLADLQDFWTGELSAGDGFVPPTGGYISMDSAPPEGSGLRSSALCITDPAQIAGNAYYCPQGDGIVFDSSALVPVLLDHYGSAGLAASFAHEFGHAIQARIGPTAADRVQDPDRYPSILVEAQADCDAGAFLGWASTGSGSRVHAPAGFADPCRGTASRLPRPGDGLPARSDRARTRARPAQFPADRAARRRRRLLADGDRRPATDPRPRGGHHQSAVDTAAVRQDRRRGGRGNSIDRRLCGRPAMGDPGRPTERARPGRPDAGRAARPVRGGGRGGSGDRAGRHRHRRRCRLLHGCLGGLGVRAGRGRRAGLLAHRCRRGAGPDPVQARRAVRRTCRLRRRLPPGQAAC